MRRRDKGMKYLWVGRRLTGLVLVLTVVAGCGSGEVIEPEGGKVTLPPSPTTAVREEPSPSPQPGAALTTQAPTLTPVPPATLAPTATPAPEAAPVWGQWGGSRFRNWQSAEVGPARAPSLLWALDLPASIAAEPLVLGDGSLRVVTAGGTLVALSPDGTEQWRFEAGGEPLAPALGRGGSTYLAVRSGVQAQTVALSPAGDALWQHTVEYGLAEAPLVDADGNLYLVSFLGEVFSLSDDGTERWRWKPENVTVGHLVMDASDVLYAGPILSGQVFGRATPVWALDARNGAEQWWMREGGLAGVDASGEPYFVGEGLFRVRMQGGSPLRQDISLEEARTLDVVRVRPVGGSVDPEASTQSFLIEMTSDAAGNYVGLLVQVPMEGSPPPEAVLQLVAYDLQAEEVLWQQDTDIAAAGVQPFLRSPDERRTFTAPVVGPAERVYLAEGSTFFAYGP
jgi:outer membrane protein assembly factor BamB